MCTSSKVPISDIPCVLTTYTRYSRTYESSIAFDGQPFDSMSDSWIRNLVHALAAQSTVRRFGHTEIMMFKRGLEHALMVDSARSVLLADAKSISHRDIYRLFESIAAEDPTISSETKLVRNRANQAFRQRVLEFGETDEFGGSVSRVTVAFRTRQVKTSPRKIISDLVGLSGSIEERLPLDAMPHDTLKELTKRARDRIKFDIQKIIDACVEDLIYWRNIRNDLIRLSEDATTSDALLLQAVESTTKKNYYSLWARNRLINADSHELIKIYAREIKLKNLAHISQFGTWTFVGAGAALGDVYERPVQLQGSGSYKILFLPYRMHAQELIAAFVLLMIYTAWNMHALVRLTSDRIRNFEGGYEIQGFKSKTDDDTPSVFIDKSHRFGFEAIELIIWNAQQLKALGRLAAHDTGLWYCYSSVESRPYSSQYVGFQDAVAEFCRRHDFAHFSFDQIRAQVLFDSALPLKYPEETRRLAGHKQIFTTGIYLDQEFARRLASANNLEFQRRFEQTVKYRIAKKRGLRWLAYDEAFVDPDIMVPVGDGTLCAEPKKPPRPEYLHGGNCDARRCHGDGECPNQRIVLDEPRLRELIRKRRYYLASWQRLLRENPGAFNEFHAPAMLFNFALYDFVQEGPYGHVLRHLEGAIT